MKNTTPYTINISWSDEDEAFVATVPGLPYCCAHGDTFYKAFEAAILAIQSIMEEMQ